jgi:hypothetical protein
LVGEHNRVPAPDRTILKRLRPPNSIWLTLWDESSRRPSLATHVI